MLTTKHGDGDDYDDDCDDDSGDDLQANKIIMSRSVGHGA